MGQNFVTVMFIAGLATLKTVVMILSTNVKCLMMLLLMSTSEKPSICKYLFSILSYLSSSYRTCLESDCLSIFIHCHI